MRATPPESCWLLEGQPAAWVGKVALLAFRGSSLQGAVGRAQGWEVGQPGLSAGRGGAPGASGMDSLRPPRGRAHTPPRWDLWAPVRLGHPSCRS